MTFLPAFRIWLCTVFFGVTFLTAFFLLLPRTEAQNNDDFPVPYYRDAGPESGATSRKNDLSLPHRSPRQIEEWMTVTVSRSLSLEHNNYRQHLDQSEAYFAPSAWKEFNKTLAELGITARVQARNQDVEAFVTQRPYILNDQALKGHYRWLIEVPVMLSFYDGELSSRSGQTPENQKFLITSQITRVRKGPGAENLMIETWDIQPLPE